jgi:hypothetical protein
MLEGRLTDTSVGPKMYIRLVQRHKCKWAVGTFGVQVHEGFARKSRPSGLRLNYARASHALLPSQAHPACVPDIGRYVAD